MQRSLYRIASLDLKHSLDPNGREIYVEKEDARGKLLVWYLPIKDDKFTHKERDTFGPNNTTVDGPVCLFRMKQDPSDT